MRRAAGARFCVECNMRDPRGAPSAPDAGSTPVSTTIGPFWRVDECRRSAASGCRRNRSHKDRTTVTLSAAAPVCPTQFCPSGTALGKPVTCRNRAGVTGHPQERAFSPRHRATTTPRCAPPAILTSVAGVCAATKPGQFRHLRRGRRHPDERDGAASASQLPPARPPIPGALAEAEIGAVDQSKAAFLRRA